MTPEQVQSLAESLTEIYEQGGFIPAQAYRPFHKLCSWAAVELLIVRNEGQEVLLRYRNDEPWDGWHVIGGYVKGPETVQAFANRVVQEECAGFTSVTNFRQIATSKWLDHPYSYPFCALLVCNPVGNVIERHNLRWFGIANLPFGKMLHPKHDLYLKTYLEFLKNPERYCPVIGE